MKIGFKSQSDHGKGIVSSDVNVGFSLIIAKIDPLSLGTVTTQQANGVKGSGQSYDIAIKGKYSINEEEEAKIIEGIRREGFGWDPAFLAIEESILKKQNARLGRVLHRYSTRGWYLCIYSGWSNLVAYGSEPDHHIEAFRKMHTKLQVVNPALLIDSHAENITQMLYKVGVQWLSEHEVLKKHFLPAISNERKYRIDNPITFFHNVSPRNILSRVSCRKGVHTLTVT
ncbi:hypothetical protein Tco_0668919 [Tanacetum coccineum]